jgi:hypothetical protein
MYEAPTWKHGSGFFMPHKPDSWDLNPLPGSMKTLPLCAMLEIVMPQDGIGGREAQK